MPVDVRGPGELVHLTEALEAAGWHEEAITAFCNGNWERTLALA
jgi:microsomal dipeptidase-like Zn-dependent dipeptidase